MLKLPPDDAERVWDAAALAPGVHPPTADFHDQKRLLSTFSKNFVQLRYPYERYMEESPAALRARSEEWIEAGAPVEEADFVYYPTELGGLTHALEQEVDGWLRDYSKGEACP